MRLSLLGSGSSGNVAYIEATQSLGTGRSTRLLIDAGLSRSEIEARLLGVDPLLTLGDLDAVLVTHDHSDHAGCARLLGRPIFATQGTLRACGFEGTRVIDGTPFVVGSLTVHPVLLPHDAVETVGYVIQEDNTRIGILTDCGHDDPRVAEAYAGCDALILETNHDATLLKYGPYPPSLKRRVGGRLGHLSNDQAASLLRMISKAGSPPKVVIAAHLSQANNRPALAKSALDRVLGQMGGRAGRVLLATQARGAPTLTVERGRVRIEPAKHEQLTFEFAPQKPEAVLR